MSMIEVDTARLPTLLATLRLPTVAQLWPRFAERADAEGWPAARFLAAVLEHEVAERTQRRIQRHLHQAKLPPGKTLASFEFAPVPGLSKAQVLALAEGGAWLDSGANVLVFGPPGVGKTHLGAALGHALIERGYRVLFTRTTDLVQHLQAARQALSLPNALAKLDKFDLLILDDLTYAHKSQGETSVLFELIAERYERKSLLITANQPFGHWETLFPDKAMTVAAIDRLVHHATVLEMNAESYRRRTALDRHSAKLRASVDANASTPPRAVAKRADAERQVRAPVDANASIHPQAVAKPADAERQVRAPVDANASIHPQAVAKRADEEHPVGVPADVNASIHPPIHDPVDDKSADCRQNGN